MIIHSVTFLGSSTSMSNLPPPDLPEYAFAGRSNVGKSSMINLLTGIKSTARISSKPGKTTTINHFAINSTFLFADLPGYGYAKSSKHTRLKWHAFSKQYLLSRSNLLTVFCLIDSRLSPQQSDLDFMHFLGTEEIPFVIIFTKTDKLSKSALHKTIDAYLLVLSETWEPLPAYYLSSCKNKSGRNAILDFIEKTNSVFTGRQ